MPRSRTLPALLLVALLGAGAPALSSSATETVRRLVTTAPGTDPAQVLAGSGLAVDVLLGRVAVVEGPAGAVDALAVRPEVVAVERSQQRVPMAVPDDRRYDQQWAHELTGVEQAWDVSTGSRDVLVAVIDSGVDGRHPDLDSNLVGQYAFVGGARTDVPLGTDNRGCGPDDGHGTHVAGIIGADGNDGEGVAGVNWDVSILDLRVFEDVVDCGADDADTLAALGFAVEQGASVVNMSIGSPSGSCTTAFAAAVEAARDEGTLVVAASGNEQEETPGVSGVPASCPGVVSVGAVTRDGDPAPYSNQNPHVDLAGPGGDIDTNLEDGILSTVRDGRYDWYPGTSMATPYVTGVAALLKAVDPGLTPDQLEAVLEATATDAGASGRDDAFGWGVVDAAAAVQMAAGTQRPALRPDPAFPVTDEESEPIPGPEPVDPTLDRIAAGSATEAVAQAVAASQTTFDDDETGFAVLARRDVFADALAGASLTYGLAPLLFSGSTGPLPAATRAELQRVVQDGGTVYLLGGPAALPTTLEAELEQLGFVPERLAGQTREQTAVAVSVALDEVLAGQDLEPADTVLLATSGNWPDAVAGGALGAFLGLPVLLTPPGTLNPATRDRLAAAQPSEVVALGGTTVLSDAVVAAAGAAAGAGTTRLAGPDRYGTAVAIADYFEDVLAEQDEALSCVLAANLVRADGFAHVLSSAPLAGAYGCALLPVLGADGRGLPRATVDFARGLDLSGWAVGGTDLVPAATVSELEALLAG